MTQTKSNRETRYFSSRFRAIMVAGVCGFAGVAVAQQPEIIARKAMISSITGNMVELRQAFSDAQTLETSTGDRRSVKSSDIIFYLYNSSSSDRELFLSGQEIIASNIKDGDFKNRVLVSLLSDEVYELNRLEGQNRFNKFSRVFNRASTGLSQLVMLQPQAAVSLLWDGIYSVRKAKTTTVKERKMIFLCTAFLKKYPNAPERAEVEALRENLLGKLREERSANYKVAGKNALAQGKYALAEYSFDRANLIKLQNDDAAALLSQARTMRNRVEEMRFLSLGVSGEESTWDSQVNETQSAALKALVTGKYDTLAALKAKAPRLADSIDYAIAASFEKTGDHDKAINYFAGLSAQAPQSPGGKAAAMVLQNSKYNLDKGFETAIAEMSSERTKFIWTGNRSKEDTVYATGNAAIQSANNAALGIPILFGMDAGVRAISEQFRTQISVDAVVDAGAQYIRRYPQSPRSKQIAAQLAQLSKKAGDFKKSESFLEESGTGTPEELAKLKENQAVKLFETAKQSQDFLEKRRLLTELTEKFAETNIVKKSVAAEIAKIPPSIGNDSVVIVRKALVSQPDILRYLGIPMEWADDKRSNQELGDEGISINPTAGNVEFSLRGENGFRQVPLPEQGREWILSNALQIRQNYEIATGSKDAVYRQKIPFAIDGGVGSSGVDVAPQVIPHPTTADERKRFN